MPHKDTCSIEGCTNPRKYANGWCGTHYARNLRRGSPYVDVRAWGRTTCIVAGCDDKHYGHGWCSKHYQRWERHGDALYRRPTAEERFWKQVDIRGPNECWPWKGSTQSNGYGTFWANGKQVAAHRFAYELVIGPIPYELQLDHVWTRGCRSKLCCNPAHLEPVTWRENLNRGLARRHA